MGPIGCPGMSVRNYHPTLCNIQEEQRSHLPHVRSMESCTLFAGTLWLRLEIHDVQTVCWFLPHKECLKISNLNLWRELYHYFCYIPHGMDKENIPFSANYLVVVRFLLGNSLVSEFYMPTFQNTLSVPSS